MKIAKNSNFCSTSNRRAVPIELTRTKILDAAGFPVTSKGKSSILFEDQLDNHILQVFKSFELLISALSCSLCRMNWCISLRSIFHMFIMQSFEFFFASENSGR